MDDNVKDVAERYAESKHDLVYSNDHLGTLAWQEDMKILADAFLARLDADQRREEERALPVTYDELEELFASGDNIIASPWQLKGKLLVDIESAVEITTRGQLLDLLAALNIQPREPS